MERSGKTMVVSGITMVPTGDGQESPVLPIMARFDARCRSADPEEQLCNLWLAAADWCATGKRAQGEMWDAHDGLMKRAGMELQMCQDRHDFGPAMEAAQVWVSKMTFLRIPLRPSLDYILDACACTQELCMCVACALVCV
jgi:hypothetical protein